jgi:hypothetical protein
VSYRLINHAEQNFIVQSLVMTGFGMLLIFVFVFMLFRAMNGGSKALAAPTDNV